MCGRTLRTGSGNGVTVHQLHGRHVETKYGIPWIKVNSSVSGHRKSLRKIAKYSDNAGLMEQREGHRRKNDRGGNRHRQL